MAYFRLKMADFSQKWPKIGKNGGKKAKIFRLASLQGFAKFSTQEGGFGLPPPWASLGLDKIVTRIFNYSNTINP